jgi:hypothetical protein
MLPSSVIKYLKKESAMDIQVIVVVLLEYSIACVLLKHEVQLSDTQKFSFFFVVGTGTFVS